MEKGLQENIVEYQPALGTKKCNKSFVMTKPEKVSERLK